jgi:hypothetical protein
MTLVDDATGGRWPGSGPRKRSGPPPTCCGGGSRSTAGRWRLHTDWKNLYVRAPKDDCHRRTPSRVTLDRVLQLEETRVLSNDWVIGYATRYFQVARQSHLAPAWSTALARDSGTTAEIDAPSGSRTAPGWDRRPLLVADRALITRGAAATTSDRSEPSRRVAVNDKGRWTLPAPWTRRRAHRPSPGDISISLRTGTFLFRFDTRA